MSAIMIMRIVVADDHPVVLEGVVRLLEAESGLEVVARCTSGEAALEAVRKHQPDILVLDLNMPVMSGMRVLRIAAQEGLQVRVVLLTADLRADDLFEAVRLGVRGVILKDMAPDLLMRCIRTVHSGGQWLEQHLTALNVDRLPACETTKRQLDHALTRRETELVQLITKGLRNKEIAFQLGITEGTVKIHLHRIYEKLEINNRVELADYVREKFK